MAFTRESNLWPELLGTVRAGPALPWLAGTLQQLSVAARPRPAARSLAALSALAFFLCLISIGLPPGSSALPLGREPPPAAGTLTLALEGGWQAPPAAGRAAEDTWAAPMAWGWFFLARLARRRRARAAARLGPPESSSSGGDPSSSGQTPGAASARPAGCPWAGSPGVSLPGEALALGWGDPACPSPPLDDPLPWAYSGGLCLAGLGEACEASLAEPLPWAAELLDPLPSLGPLGWLMEGSGPISCMRMEDGPPAPASTHPRWASAVLPRPPSWQGLADLPLGPGAAAGGRGGAPWVPPPAPPTCSPGGSSSRSSRLEAALLPPAGITASTQTSSGCPPSLRSCGPRARGGGAAAAPAAAPLPSPAAAPDVQGCMSPAPTPAPSAAATPPRNLLAARPAAPRTAAMTSGSCSPAGSPGFAPLGFAPLGFAPLGQRPVVRARGARRTPLADALAPLGAALLAAQAFAEQRLGSPLAPSKVVVTEG